MSQRWRPLNFLWVLYTRGSWNHLRTQLCVQQSLRSSNKLKVVPGLLLPALMVRRCYLTHPHCGISATAQFIIKSLTLLNCVTSRTHGLFRSNSQTCSSRCIYGQVATLYLSMNPTAAISSSVVRRWSRWHQFVWWFFRLYTEGSPYAPLSSQYWHTEVYSLLYFQERVDYAQARKRPAASEMQCTVVRHVFCRICIPSIHVWINSEGYHQSMFYLRIMAIPQLDNRMRVPYV